MREERGQAAGCAADGKKGVTAPKGNCSADHSCLPAGTDPVSKVPNAIAESSSPEPNLSFPQ